MNTSVAGLHEMLSDGSLPSFVRLLVDISSTDRRSPAKKATGTMLLSADRARSILCRIVVAVRVAHSIGSSSVQATCERSCYVILQRCLVERGKSIAKEILLPLLVALRSMGCVGREVGKEVSAMITKEEEKEEKEGKEEKKMSVEKEEEETGWTALLERYLRELKETSAEEKKMKDLIALILTEVHCRDIMVATKTSLSSNVSMWLETPLFANGLSAAIDERKPTEATRELLEKTERLEVPKAQLRAIAPLLKMEGEYGESGRRLLRWTRVCMARLFGATSRRVRSQGHKAVSLVRTLQKQSNLSARDVVELCDRYTERVLLLCRANCGAAVVAAEDRAAAEEEEGAAAEEETLLRLVIDFLQDGETSVASMEKAVRARTDEVVRRVGGLRRLTTLVETCDGVLATVVQGCWCRMRNARRSLLHDAVGVDQETRRSSSVACNSFLRVLGGEETLATCDAATLYPLALLHVSFSTKSEDLSMLRLAMERVRLTEKSNPHAVQHANFLYRCFRSLVSRVLVGCCLLFIFKTFTFSIDR